MAEMSNEEFHEIMRGIGMNPNSPWKSSKQVREDNRRLQTAVNKGLKEERKKFNQRVNTFTSHLKAIITGKRSVYTKAPAASSYNAVNNASYVGQPQQNYNEYNPAEDEIFM